MKPPKSIKSSFKKYYFFHNNIQFCSLSMQTVYVFRQKPDRTKTSPFESFDTYGFSKYLKFSRTGKNIKNFDIFLNQ